MATAIDLTPFCDEPGGRYSLEKPFVIRGWEYATDGKVLVRIPAQGDPDAPAERRVPRKPEECVPDVPADRAWHRFPKVRECKTCAGHGYIDIPCHACGQDTKELCECKKNVVALGKAAISRHYAALISSLPGVEYAEPQDATDSVRFRFEGGEGAICQMRHGAYC